MKAKLCGRITDHPTHPWEGRDADHSGAFDSEGYLRRVIFQCPGHIDIEGGQRRHHPKETS